MDGNQKTIFAIVVVCLVFIVTIVHYAPQPCGVECQVERERSFASIETEKIRVEGIVEAKRLEAEAAKAYERSQEPDEVKYERVEYEFRKEELDAQRKHEIEIENIKAQNELKIQCLKETSIGASCID